ncbi:redox-regulated ATPase YchF [Litorilinea aerophila]|uniref:Ribosome-binding ATPase YchF n=1 Tax=Litorilinea aerophila TaxID=1204385 RepID=A0A540VC77_9CHLR|nr:redox-regulated ATPase YchF [Litorilinea aerophila]MCC9077751.1 redox-regulated ATPase YchF [Litorilinea aerophila]OUC09872.1 GTP-binding protein [Litorilinea aerophila]
MGLTIGLIGLPNVGKSTVFNALIEEQQAEVANYPFCTIEPNRAIVPVRDPRVETIARLTGVARIIYATVEFVDIAGLVKGASQGEGLGNQFLGHIRNTAALVHVVRCFEDENVVHVHGELDPRADIETVNLELILADLEQLQRKIERLSRQAKADRHLQPVLDLARRLEEHLAAGRLASQFQERESQAFQQLNRELQFLTAKPVIYAANVDEAGLAEDNDYVRAVQAVAAEQGAAMVKLCAQLEAEMAGLSLDERHQFLQASGASESGLEQVVRTSFRLLGLITFFTFNEEEARAWEIPQGSTAPEAAGTIHTDFQRGFIRAEVLPYEQFVQYGSWQAARTAGAVRLEGKEYVVQDGDIIFFRFHV